MTTTDDSNVEDPAAAAPEGEEVVHDVVKREPLRKSSRKFESKYYDVEEPLLNRYQKIRIAYIVVLGVIFLLGLLSLSWWLFIEFVKRRAEVAGGGSGTLNETDSIMNSTELPTFPPTSKERSKIEQILYFLGITD
jgi:hypothetical protein